jgi:hypothetical protein
MAKPLIQPGPVPPPFQAAQIPPFCIDRIVQDGDTVLLHYILEAAGPGLNVKDKYLHETLGGKVEVAAGGWYHTYGRWSLLERYMGTLKCTGVTELLKLDAEGLRNEFFVEKSWWRKTLTVTVESERLGLYRLRCATVTPQPFQTLAFDKRRQVWVDKEELLRSLGISGSAGL